MFLKKQLYSVRWWNALDTFFLFVLWNPVLVFVSLMLGNLWCVGSFTYLSHRKQHSLSVSGCKTHCHIGGSRKTWAGLSHRNFISHHLCCAWNIFCLVLKLAELYLVSAELILLTSSGVIRALCHPRPKAVTVLCVAIIFLLWSVDKLMKRVHVANCGFSVLSICWFVSRITQKLKTKTVNNLISC